MGGICLMGGASENDNAMTWFLNRANGGDILVLRASGSDGYNDYMYSGLSANVNSVETIVFNDSTASNESYIHQKIQQAEAIWFAGGNQWDYISYWRNSSIDSLINDGILNRNIVIGGTSAGMAIQGGFYFSAMYGTVISSTALDNPFNLNVTVDSTAFISNQYLSNVITDTHYDNPNRKGRHLVFLARILNDYGIRAKGIACDEHTAVCIDENGIAKIFGDFPNYDDNAYFINPNCELMDIIPETCSANLALDWNLNNKAIKVYSVKGTPNGDNTFNLSDWESGNGGVWENWFVNQGTLNEQSGIQPNCNSLSINHSIDPNTFIVYQNEAQSQITILFNETKSPPKNLEVLNVLGGLQKTIEVINPERIQLNLNHLNKGVYFIKITYYNNQYTFQKISVN